MKTRVLGFVALLAVVAAAIFGLFVVPADLNQGDAQRVMYVHVGSAWLGELSFGLAALAGLGYLWRRDLRFDALAHSAVEVGVLFTAFAIWGGMMWGKPVWGVFWQWEDPRLATTALLLALGVGYLLLRRLSDDPARRASRAAVVGLIAGLDIPIIHFSVIWWRGLHQGSDHRRPGKAAQPLGPGALRGGAARHAGRLHADLGLAHDPALPAGPPGVADRGGGADEPHQRRARRRTDSPPAPSTEPAR